MIVGLGACLGLWAGCANPVGWDSLEGTEEWRTARAAFALEFGGMTASCERAPLVHYVAPTEFRERCLRDPCSDGEAGHCSHACASFVGLAPVVIADEGQGPDYGRWVLVHESMHVLARCTRLHGDGDAAHSDSRLWSVAFPMAMQRMIDDESAVR